MFKRLRMLGFALRSAAGVVVSTLSNPQRWLVDMFGGSESKAGVRVNEDTAVQVTAVFACVRLLAQTLASLPLHTYRRLEDGSREKAFEHPLYRVLHVQANPECTSYTFRIILMVNLLLTGHAFAEIQRDGGGRIEALWPIPTSRVSTKRNTSTKELYYLVSLPNGEEKRIYAASMLHLQWIGIDNHAPYRPVELAREAIGLSIAVEQFGGQFFANGANVSGIAEYPQKLSDEAYRRFKSSFNDKYTGLSRSHRVMFLEQGLKFHQLTVNPNDAQAIETRKFQVIEVCRFYNVPPHLIMDLERATFSNVEHQDISFVKYSLRPYLVSWEQEMFRTLFSAPEQEEYYVEFNADALLRGDSKTQAEVLEIELRNGIINADEWRALKNFAPQPDGKGQKYYVPLNWTEKGDQPADEGRMHKRSQDKGPLHRLRLARSYERVFRDAIQRAVVREKQDVSRKARKTLGERSQDEFVLWLEEFYREAPSWLKKVIMPTLLSYTESIQAAAAEEVGAEVGMTPELERWMDGYGDIWAKGYAASSRNQLKALLRKAAETGDDPLDAVEQRLSEWEEKKAGKAAKSEVIESAGVVSKFVFAAVGYRYLTWVNTGSDTCPYCQELNGKVVAIDRPFLGKDEQLDSDDGEMNIRRPTLTPPLHNGCVCMIAPK